MSLAYESMVFEPIVSMISGGNWFKGSGGEEEDDEGFIIAMTGMIWGCEGGLVSISGMIFSLPFICRKVKKYCENHCDHLNNCAFGMVFFLRFSIRGNADMSDSTRKL